MPDRAAGGGIRARRRAHSVIERFGFLQVDSVSVAGARTHGIVLASRLAGFGAATAETLLRPGEPLFEYWGHEASWMPITMYPWFEFRRREFRVHPWWGDVLAEHPKLARDIVARIERDGPLRSIDLEGKGGPGWSDLKLACRVAEALWSAGDLAIRERRGFQRTFDLVERVIPAAFRSRPLDDEASMDRLLLRALAGHGWATTGTLAATWRLVNRRDAIHASLNRLAEESHIVACGLRASRDIDGWIRTEDLDLVDTLAGLRPRRDRAILLSPFDPVLWDRRRTRLLFDFEQVLEIYKPARQRRYGYYCLPVLAGERLIGRIDLKADRRGGVLHVQSCHFENTQGSGRATPRDVRATGRAVHRFGSAVGLRAPASLFESDG